MTPETTDPSGPTKHPPTPRRTRLATFFRRLLGIRRTIVVAGVRYRERSGVPLHRIHHASGPAHKDYDATFPTGETMRIRVTPDRDYPDVTGTTRPSDSNLLEQLARPGMRIGLLGCGTGMLGEWLGLCVGPSGGVIGIDRDGESIRYARRRHAAPNVAFEIGGIETLAREFAGAFDGLVVTDPSLAPERSEALELWALTKPGGWMLIARPIADAIGTEVPAINKALSRASDGPKLVVLVKPGPGPDPGSGS